MIRLTRRFPAMARCRLRLRGRPTRSVSAGVRSVPAPNVLTESERSAHHYPDLLPARLRPAGPKRPSSFPYRAATSARAPTVATLEHCPNRTSITHPGVRAAGFLPGRRASARRFRRLRGLRQRFFRLSNKVGQRRRISDAPTNLWPGAHRWPVQPELHLQPRRKP